MAQHFQSSKSEQIFFLCLDGVKPRPLFITDVRLIDNHLLITPNIEDIQKALRKSWQLVCFSAKCVDKWSDEKRVPLPEVTGVQRRASRKRVLSVASNHSDHDAVQFVQSLFPLNVIDCPFFANHLFQLGDLKRPSRLSVMGSVRTMGSIFSKFQLTFVLLWFNRNRGNKQGLRTFGVPL